MRKNNLKKVDMPLWLEEKKSLNHNILSLNYYDGDKLCSVIYADFTDETIAAENYNDNIIKTAFGNNLTPSWTDFMEFLEERCIPRTRAGLHEYLRVLGLYEYDPLDIIRKTQGRMAEDNQWIKIEQI